MKSLQDYITTLETLCESFTGKVVNERVITTLKDDAPSWCLDVVRECHFGAWPNDSAYALCQQLADDLLDDVQCRADGIEFIEDDCLHTLSDRTVNIYTQDAIDWLTVHTIEWVDDALDEFDPKTVTDLLAMGQYKQAYAVLSLIHAAILNQLDDEEEGV